MRWREVGGREGKGCEMRVTCVRESVSRAAGGGDGGRKGLTSFAFDLRLLFEEVKLILVVKLTFSF